MTLLSTANLTNLAIPIITTTPTTNGDFAGETKLLVLPDRTILYIWDESVTEWQLIATSITGTVIPSGTVTPDVIGQIYVNTTAQNIYVAIGLTNTSWKLIA
jgi:hypothetical protein